MLHGHDGKADCSDVLYIFSVRMSVYHACDFEESVVRETILGVSGGIYMYLTTHKILHSAQNLQINRIIHARGAAFDITGNIPTSFPSYQK